MKLELNKPYWLLKRNRIINFELTKRFEDSGLWMYEVNVIDADGMKKDRLDEMYEFDLERSIRDLTLSDSEFFTVNKKIEEYEKEILTMESNIKNYKRSISILKERLK